MTQYIFADLVQQTTDTQGTGPISPNGVITGYRAFAAALSTGDQFYYVISGAPADHALYEVGIGTFTSGGAISRAPIVSSRGNSALNLPAGLKTVSLTAAAAFFTTLQADDIFAAWQAIPGNEALTVNDFVDAALNVNGVTVNAPALVSFANSTTALTIKPVNPILNSAGGNDAVSTKLITNCGRFSQGPTGQANYYDTVMALGLNMTSAFAPDNPDMPSCSIRIQSKFAQGDAGSAFISEYHLASLFPPSDPGNEYRAIAATIPHDPAKWGTSDCAVGQRGAMHIQWDGAGNGRIYSDFRPGGGAIDYQDGGSGDGHPRLRFNTNNKAAFQQINAAGDSYLSLPYLNNQNALYVSSSIHGQGPATSSAAVGGSTALFSLQAVSGLDNLSYMCAFIDYAGVTGTLNGFYMVGGATAALHSQTINITAGGRVGDTYRSEGGIIFRTFHDNTNSRRIGHTYYPTGGGYLALDDAQQAGQYRTKEAYRVDYATFQLRFAVAPRLPNFAVAGLPSASTMGAGSMAFCTNETGGAVPVFSDGTDWRRCTDRAVVS